MKKNRNKSPLIIISILLVILVYTGVCYGTYTFSGRIKEYLGLGEAATVIAAVNSDITEPDIKTSKDEAVVEEPLPDDSVKEDSITPSETEENTDNVVKPEFPITPEFYAKSGGKFKTLGSGERVYTFTDGEQAKACWVEDAGKFYYIDYSGCAMKNNYTEEGFFTKDDGSWDDTIPMRIDNTEPVIGKKYGTDPYVEISAVNKDGYDYTEAKITYSFGYYETFKVTPLDNSVYLLSDEADETAKVMSVSEDQSKIVISGYGETSEYELN